MGEYFWNVISCFFQGMEDLLSHIFGGGGGGSMFSKWYYLLLNFYYSCLVFKRANFFGFTLTFMPFKFPDHIRVITDITTPDSSFTNVGTICHNCNVLLCGVILWDVLYWRRNNDHLKSPQVKICFTWVSVSPHKKMSVLLKQNIGSVVYKSQKRE